MEGRYRYRLLSCETGTGKKTPGGAGTHTGHTCETGRVNLSVSFVAVPRAHHRLKAQGTAPNPLGQHKYTEYSLARATQFFASEVGLSQHTG